MATGLQGIINVAESIEIDRRKVVGVQYSRSEIVKVSSTPTRNPWKFTVKVSAGLPYSDARALLASIDNLDRSTPDVISFGNNANLAWITRYQGDMTALQVSAITVQSFVGNQLVLTGLPATTSTNYLFKSGDYIQIGAGTTHPFPFTVVGDVQRGSESTVTITTHRPNFISTEVTNLGIQVGKDVSFKMLCTNMPTYRLIPGATQRVNGVMTNNAYIEWDSDFEFYEYTGGA